MSNSFMSEDVHAQRSSEDPVITPPMPERRSQRPIRRRKMHPTSIVEEDEGFEYDTDQDSLPGQEEDFSFEAYDNHLLEQSLEWMDVSAISAPAAEEWKSTTVVEESKFQVHFCEMTVQEMNQIMQWWSSNPNMADHDNNIEELPAEQLLLRNSLILEDDEDADVTSVAIEDKPSTTEAADESPTTHYYEIGLGVSRRSRSRSSNNLLVDQPLPQDVAFFSPVRATSFFGLNETNESLAAFDLSSPAHDDDGDDIHVSAQQQHQQIARLLFQTQDMADQIAVLTDETSATEEDEDSDDDVKEKCNQDVSYEMTHPNGQFKNSLRRRNRGKKTVSLSTADTSSINLNDSQQSEDSTPTWMQLNWRDHVRLWARRHLRRLETTVVSKVLAPVLPLPLLLFLLHRPTVLRSMMLSTMLLIVVFFWYWFMVHIQPSTLHSSVQLFVKQPYYTSDLHYSLQMPMSFTIGSPANVEDIISSQDDHWRI